MFSDRGQGVWLAMLLPWGSSRVGGGGKGVWVGRGVVGRGCAQETKSLLGQGSPCLLTRESGLCAAPLPSGRSHRSWLPTQ